MKKDPNPVMHIRLPEEMKAKLFEIAAKEDLTPSQIVRHLVKHWLTQETPPQIVVGR